MKKILVTVLVTINLAAIGLMVFLVANNCITITKYETNHNKVVMVDGVVTKNTSWNVLDGFEVSLNFNDSVKLMK